MLPRLVSLGLLLALLGIAPAAAKGRPAAFPNLHSGAWASKRTQAVERRVRRIETSVLGRAHAVEHARQRGTARAVRRRRSTRGQQAPAPLQPDNSLQPPSVGGVWTPGVKLPIIAINATLMRTGKVLVFAYPWRSGQPDPDNPGQILANPGYADAYVFDPATGTSKKVTPPVDPNTGKPAFIFCAATSTLPDGRVLVVGGVVGEPTSGGNRGLDTIYTFDPMTESWQTQRRTRQGRWYPSNLEMADGRTLILAGAPNTTDPDWPSHANGDVEVFSADGGLQLYSSFRVDGANGHPPLIGEYPHLFWMPGGHALIAGPRRSDTWTFKPPAAGAEAGSGDWAEVADLPTHREWAAGALLPGTARAMLFGGADRDDRYGGPPSVWPATATTTFYDEAAPGLGWRAGPDMHASRAFANSVLLPDGKVAVIGGGSGDDSRTEYPRSGYDADHRRVDLFDPDANTFTFGNAQAEGRTYHSTALLLPDGRVMSAGDDIHGPTGPGSGVRTDTAEMWSPPYLFNGCRPTITSVPASVAYNSQFEVQTRDALSGAVLVAPGAVTHDNDMGQRVVPLAPPVPVAGGVRLRTPYDANAAPPGPYMLFLRNLRGVPSVARFVKLGGTAPGVAPPIAAPPTPAGCPPDGPGPDPSPSPSPSPTPSPGPSPTPTATPVALRVKLAASAPRLRGLRTGRRPLAATIALSAGARVSVRVAVERTSRGRVRLKRIAAPLSLGFAGAGTRRVKIRPSRPGRRSLTHRRAVTIRLTATARPRWGPVAKATRRLRVR